MAQRNTLAVAAGADLNLVPGLGTIGRDIESLLAGRHQLDRPLQGAGELAIIAVRGVIEPLEPKAPPT
jgi:hypothetical protein